MKATHSRTIKLRPIDARSAPHAPGIELGVRAYLTDAQAKKKPRLHSNERGDAFFFFSGKSRRVGVVHEGAVHEVDVPVELDAHAALSPDGKWLLTTNGTDDHLEAHLTAVGDWSTTRVACVNPKKQSRLARSPSGVAFTPDGFVLLAAGGVLMAFANLDDVDQQPTSSHKIERGGYKLLAALQGRLLITHGKGKSVLLFTVRNGELELLKKINKLDLPQYVYEAPGRVVIDDAGACLELDGVVEACGWSEDGLPPAAEHPLETGPVEIRATTERTCARLGSGHNAFHVHPLADGRALCFDVQKSDEWAPTFRLSVLEGDAAAPVDAHIHFSTSRGPVYAVAPDERSAVFLTRADEGTSVFQCDLETREWTKLGDLERNCKRVVHLGDRLLLSGGNKPRRVMLDPWQASNSKISKADELIAYCAGRVVLACTSTGTHRPPSTNVWVHREGKFERVGKLAIGARTGWTAEGRHFVSCWHGRRSYELMLDDVL